MLANVEKEKLRRLLSDTLLLLCQNSLPVRANFSIEALIGLTLENDEVLLVSVKKNISGAEDVPCGSSESQHECVESITSKHEDGT